MNGEVDWELLADHLGGALAGTPEGDRVAQLVSTDPSWARAATELSAAIAAVTRDLRTLPPVTMPDDVTARLDRALAAAVGAPEAASAPDVAAAPGGAGAPDAAPAAPAGRPVAESRRPPSHPGARKRRRAARWGAGLALAAGVAAFSAVSLTEWQPDQTFPDFIVEGSGDEDKASDGSTDQLAPEAAAPTADEEAGPLMVATGSNYEAATLAITEPARPTPVLGHQNRPSPPVQAPENELGVNEAPPSVVPDPLAWLWLDPAERNECLALIAAALQPPPVSITTVDFATFEGEPALIVWATAGDGSRWAWVSGPDCGLVTGDPDVRYQTQIS
ncbi:MAG TPA: hypothetical protein VIL37_17515 [Natronosporangium sp.]